MFVNSKLASSKKYRVHDHTFTLTKYKELSVVDLKGETRSRGWW